MRQVRFEQNLGVGGGGAVQLEVCAARCDRCALAPAATHHAKCFISAPRGLWNNPRALRMERARPDIEPAHAATNSAAEDKKETKEKEVGGRVACVLGCVPPRTGVDRGGRAVPFRF